MKVEIKAHTTVPKLAFFVSKVKGVLGLCLAGGCLWVILNLFPEKDRWGKFVMILSIVFFGEAALYW